MSWLLLTILAIVSRAMMGIIQKVFTNRADVSPMTQAMLFTGVAGVFSLIMSPLLGGISVKGLSDIWHIALIMVLAQAFGNVLFFKGLSQLEASVTSIAFSSILIWSVMLSYLFLDSTFSVQQSIGIIVLLVAIIVAQYTKSNAQIEPAILLVLGAAFLMGIFQVASAELSNTVPAATYLLFNYIGSTALIWLIYRKRIHEDM